jgi:hypothetical protein
MSPARHLAEAGASLFSLGMQKSLLIAERDRLNAMIAEMDRRKAEREAMLLAAALPAGMAREARHGG